MNGFDGALRGYAHPVLQRDNFVCRYCGLDGKFWPNWLYLCQDHLLPPGHPERDNPDFIVCACRFCNELLNRNEWPVEGMTPEQIVEAKREAILPRRAKYQLFWVKHVKLL